MKNYSSHPDQLVPLKVAAERLGVSPKTLLRRIKDQLISAKRHPSLKKGGKPRVYLFNSEIDRYLASMPDAVAPLDEKSAKSRRRAPKGELAGVLKFV